MRKTMLIIYLSINQKKEIGSHFKRYPPTEVSTYFTRHTKEQPPCQIQLRKIQKIWSCRKIIAVGHRQEKSTPTDCLSEKKQQLRRPMETRVLSTIVLHRRINKIPHYPHHHHLLKKTATANPIWVMDQCISLYMRAMKILDDIGSFVSRNGRQTRSQMKIDRWHSLQVP